MRLSVIIPTYQRPEDLERVLNSLYGQTQPPEEIIIVIGPDDEQSHRMSIVWKAKLPALKTKNATKPSLVHALNLGLAEVNEEVICLLDDDVWLPPDWAEKIKIAYQKNDKLGAYGGRDRLQLPDEPNLMHPPPATVVGKYTWKGTVGNHHCGSVESPVRVDVLKGANLSFRRAAFSRMYVDRSLESKGAEVGTEIDICQQIAKSGFEVIYDNENYVLHFASPRSDYDSRTDVFASTTFLRLYNNALLTAKFRPFPETLLFIVKSTVLGSRVQPGLLASLYLFRKYGFKIFPVALANIIYCIKGGITGLKHR